MRRFFLLLALATACAHQAPPVPPPAPAPGPGPKPAPTYLDKLPPLVEREALFGDPEIAGGQISPDGQFISFEKPYKGQLNIWVKRRTEPFEAARPLTADTARPVRGYFWSQDGKYVLYAQDKGGDENFRVYAVDPTAAPDATAGVPPARDLTPYPNVQAHIYAVPKKTPAHILVGLNDRKAEVHDVYRLDLRTGKRELVQRNDANVAGWVADLEGKLRLGERMTSDGGTELLRVDGGKLVPVYACTADESCGVERFHKDGKRVYLTTNKGATDLTRLVLFDPRTRQEEPVDSDPERQVDFGGAQFSRATDELLATYYEGDRMRIYPKDARFAKDYELVRKALPSGDLYFGSASSDDRLHLVTITSDLDPGATYLYDRDSGKVELLYRPYPRLPLEALAPMQPVRYKARDGLEIPAYLTTPKGVDARGLPAVLLVHGGPWGRDTWGYDAFAQFLANRGYACLQPNFRGSTGYGKRFLNLGNNQWGTGTMQHDLTDGARWLADRGIADGKRIAIMGGSYGGYATLAGVAFTPEVYAAGVDIVGPSSIVTLLRSIPPYWAPIKKMFAVRVGDVENPKDVARLEAQSPLHAAKQIQSPLLVIQGANDPRVKKAEADQIVIALRDLGRPVEYLVAPDEGHGFAGKENRIAMFAAIERFLGKHLGGRAQAGMPAEIARKLAAITVDPKTVKLAAAAGALPAQGLSFEGGGLGPMKLEYAQKIETMGKTIEAATTVTVTAADKGTWAVVEDSKSSLGSATDTTWLDGKTLLPLRRSIKQGPATIELTFSVTGVKGLIKAGPQEMPVDAKVEGAVLVDGAPLHVALGTLSLAPGYARVLRTFDVMSAAVKTSRLEVKGAEDVTVRAGRFAALRLEVKPSDGAGGDTLWVERAAPHRVVKWESSLPPQMGGGTVRGELLK